MLCLGCGSEQASENTFCTKCGTRLMTAPLQPSAEGPPMPQEPAAASSSKAEEEKILRELKAALEGTDETGAGPGGQKPGLLAPKLFWLGVAVVLVAGILGAAAHLFWKKRHVEPPAPLPPVEAPVSVPAAPPVVDEATRNTVGKIAAVLEAIQKYQERKKALPPSLSSINKGYSDLESLKDGWGKNLLYLVDLTNDTYVLQSLGPDGKRGTADDVTVPGENRDQWLKEHEQTVSEWQVASPNLYAQLVSVGPTADELKNLENARKAEAKEKKRREEQLQEDKRRQEAAEQRRLLQTAREEEEKRKQAEARKREEELRQAKLREEAQRLQAMKQAGVLNETFIGGLTQWDAPSTWEVEKEKEFSVLRVQGLGFLKMSPTWDNYKIEFDIKINKESAGWVLRAQNSSNFYLFKLASDKAKAIPKNALVKYIFSESKYLNSLKREDAPGATDVVLLPFKVRNKDYYHVVINLKGSKISHVINGIHVDDWNDTTFDSGRFGFNASIIEMATIRSLSVEPLK